MNLDDDTPELTEDVLDTPEVEEGHGDPAEPEAQADEPEADEPIAFTFDGEEGVESEPEDSNVLRTVREKLRQEQREKAELRKRLEQLEQPKDDELGPEPTLESCGYDEEELKKQDRAWNAKRTEKERKAAEAQEAQRKQQEAWATRVTTFEAKANELVPNFASVAQTVGDHFGDDDAGTMAKAILIYADDPRLIAALNASPAKLAELVALKNDPTALAIAVGELKGKIRTMPRRQPPAPEAITKGGAPVAASADKELERLEKEAERTGNRTAVIAYRRKLQQNAA